MEMLTRSFTSYQTWKFDVFVIRDSREVLVGNVALHYDP